MNKSVLITGAAKGLGFSLVKEFLSQNCRVYALDLNLSDELQKLLDENEELSFGHCDVTCYEDVCNCIKELKVSSLDIVVNNAGVWLDASRKKLLDEDFSFDAFLPQYKVNALGVLHIAKQTLPLLIESGGVMVNVSSEAGSIGESGRVCEYGYCMSKAAQNMATKILSNSYGNCGVKFYALHPGWMITDQGKAGATDGYFPDQNPDDTAKFISNLCFNRNLDKIYYDNTGREFPW
jgi:NAD(P)-dependent dehydrogenase (short-subunit alcohol dehydrogenase family)